ncbi:hypothetical protein EYF80_060936 [Liparis tanakae]|uniref:Uncharacterized protein n=1 Tax=Liparis tanakae TaxID=230148 RepID=A0A4Z2EIZ1_9TELE|nr:hypothetical protein EYF80_060936 [Liparis tanakae]
MHGDMNMKCKKCMRCFQEAPPPDLLALLSSPPPLLALFSSSSSPHSLLILSSSFSSSQSKRCRLPGAACLGSARASAAVPPFPRELSR